MIDLDTAVARRFLLERFDDAELDAFCFDYFADVQQNFSLGMTKGQKIQLLLDHCRRQNRLPDLAAALERERPNLFHDYESGFGRLLAQLRGDETKEPRGNINEGVSGPVTDGGLLNNFRTPFGLWRWAVVFFIALGVALLIWLVRLGMDDPESVTPETAVPSATANPTATNTPDPVQIDIPVEINGEIFEITAFYTLNSAANDITFSFGNDSEKEPVDVVVEKAGGGDIISSGDMNKGDEKTVTTPLSADLSGVRLKIYRWAPGLFGAPGSGGGDAFLTLPTTGAVAITIKVRD